MLNRTLGYHSLGRVFPRTFTREGFRRKPSYLVLPSGTGEVQAFVGTGQVAVGGTATIHVFSAIPFTQYATGSGGVTLQGSAGVNLVTIQPLGPIQIVGVATGSRTCKGICNTKSATGCAPSTRYGNALIPGVAVCRYPDQVNRLFPSNVQPQF